MAPLCPDRPPLVDNSQIQSATLHNALPIQLHTYVWPFTIIWPAFLSVYLSPERYDLYIGGQEWTFVWVGTIVSLQALLWLMTKWNVNIDALFTCSKAKDVTSASFIKVIPIENAGSAEICKLIRERKSDEKDAEQVLSFHFQKRQFLYYPDRKCFAPLDYVIDAEPKPYLREFQSSHGLTTAKQIEETQRHYGDNVFDIPVPTFTELFKEHAVAPFFVFQVFCVGLWLLDEYWYYSIFTLVMLVVFESTVVWQRQRTLNEFRSMSIKPYDIWVHRENEWVEITSDKLLPGDLVSIQRTKEDSGVACDILMIEGNAIVNEAMLSGESTPLLKDSIQLRPGDERIDVEGLDKNAFLMGGTKVLQITHSTGSDNDTETFKAPQLASGVPRPPDDGAVGVANDRKRSKLLLDCILIITSVVPPELPMELSLAVNTSLAALSKYAIFCTEPFRIPYAGRVDIACFDKTGTLTGEDLVVDGIAGLALGLPNAKTEVDGAHTEVVPVDKVAKETTLVLATAHALVKLDDGEIVGDPMEKATLSSLGWDLGDANVLRAKVVKGSKPSASITSNNVTVDSVQIKRRFQFSSALKRQSSIATVVMIERTGGQTKRHKGTFVGVKGAPETIRQMLVDVPPYYEETFKHFTRNGARVLALAYKFLSPTDELGQSRINDLKREEVEKDLKFAGFLVLQCPLKEDALKACRMLNESSHRVVMITGDNPLTAAHVARQVEIVDRDVLILDAPENDTSGKKVVFRSADDKTIIDVDPTKRIDPTILQTKDLCVTGYALAKFKGQPGMIDLLKHAWVYARVSPKQKEEILLGMKDAGYTTLMCGDGTNDVGALKQAHVGVALLNGSEEDLAKIAEHFRITKMKELYEKQCEIMRKFNQPQPPVPLQIAHLYPPGPFNPNYEKAVIAEAEKKGIDPGEATATITSPAARALQESMTPQQRQQQQATAAAANLADRFTSSMLENEIDENEPPTIKLGDASVAAPFTSKLANVIAIPNIIRQGRCTLVATIQMYKILALNCLISAYSLSVIYLDGIKFGDGQVTISGMMMSVCFLSISRAKSVEQLSKERPQPGIFNWYIMGSILGQFAVHVATLIYISNYVSVLEPRDKNVDLEGDFQPSLLNSAIYILQLIQQVSTFSINYQGRPFRESIRENRSMYWGLVGASAIAFAAATEFVPELNEKLKLVPFTGEFKFTLTTVMIVDYVACWGIEKGLKILFSDFKPKDVAVRRADQLAREAARKKKEKDDSTFAKKRV
ncbi:P-type ATPase [Ascosphaera apis ARSEF 7405]|uniref:P-type ATPase n=1 Tax=Ascosphaera apis ARSEF 7405 TaxID=392613 RepID=A0A167V072_9EURO|nr:P-type ATPase [Ascosphaera apis ARSEF 7405]